MVFVCSVRKCVNSKVNSKNKDWKLHKIPNDKTLVHEWLKNCDRLDLRDKSLEHLKKNVRVCGKHFTAKMYSNPEHTRLLPKAVPTEFELTKNNSNDPVPSTNLDEAICEVLLERPTNSSIPCNHSVTANTISISSDTSYTSELSMISSSASTQTTQVLSVNTPRKLSLKAKVSELEKKCNQLEEQFKIQSIQLRETVTSVDHFYEVCDLHLPPNLSMFIKNYVRMSQKKPQGS